MGRWAQARRTGGGQEETGTALFMVSATISGAQQITVTFNKDFAIGDAIPDFIIKPSMDASQAIVQPTARTLDVGFAVPVAGATSIAIDNGDGLFMTNDEINIS